MATIQTIDIIKGISGKYGNKSNDYFATNKSSNKIHLAKLANPYKGPATEKQKVQREKFAKQQAASSAWLKANRPNEKNGIKGTPLYQYALKLKRTFAFSNVNQVLFKYMDEEFNIKLPDSIDAPKADGEDTGSTSTMHGMQEKRHSANKIDEIALKKYIILLGQVTSIPPKV